MSQCRSLYLSVVICTHNPRMDYLERVLAALRAQTLDVARWELLLIDNASDQPLADRVDLACHPRARCVREDELGLTPARLRGIAEAEGELLVFVDDDNVLDRDYLEQASAIAETYSFLGAWGGSSIGEFEQQPAKWLKPYIHALCIRTVKAERWAYDPGNLGPFPVGAGLCVRSAVAQRYARDLATQPLRLSFGRRGDGLMASEDVDLALTCVDEGVGYGLFPQLRLTHLIPSRRTTADYLRRLHYAHAFSWKLLKFVRFGSRTLVRRRQLLRITLSTFLRHGPRHAAMVWARQKGTRDAMLYLRSHDVGI